MQSCVHLLDELGLSVRSMKALYYYGVVTVEDLLFINKEELRKIPSMGRASFNEVNHALEKWVKESHTLGISFSDRIEFEIVHAGLSHSVSYALYKNNIRFFKDLVYVTSPDYEIRKHIRKDWIRDTIFERAFVLKDILKCHPENYFGFMAFMERIEKLFLPYLICFSDKKRLYLFFGRVFQKYFNLSFVDKSFFCSAEISNIFYNDERLTAIMRQFLLSLAGRPGKFTKKQIETKYKLFPIPPVLFQDIMDAHKNLKRQFLSGPIDGSSIDKWLLSVSPREAAMLKMRLEGTSLRAVGKVFGVSGERVRQASEREFSNKPVLREDGFADLFKKYYFKEDSFCAITGEEPKTYWYLCMLYDKGKLKIDGILNDETVPTVFRNNAKVYFRKKFKLADRLVDAIQEIAIEPITVNTFYRKYCSYLKREGIKEEFLTKRNLHARLGHISCILFNGDFDFRYYPIDSVNGKELESRLGLSSYSDIAVSSKLFFDKYPDYMKELDIRTPNELHNLLRKKADDFSCQIDFGRMPTLIFGNGSYEKQVENLLAEMGTVSRRDFMDAYCKKYGVNESIFSGRLAQYMRKFRGGKCTFLIPEGSLSEKDLRLAKKVFTAPFYSEKEVRSIMHDKFNGISSTINDKDWWDIGYKHKKDIYYLKRFSSIDEALDFLFSEPIQTFNPRGIKNAGLIYYFNVRGKEDLVHRAGHDVFVNHVWLQRNGFTRELIQDFADAVSSFVGDNTFTLKSLRKEGFYHPIFEKTTNDWLLSSFVRAHTNINTRTTKECIFFSRVVEFPGIYSIVQEIKDLREWKNAKEMHSYITEHFGYGGNLSIFTFTYKNMVN